MGAISPELQEQLNTLILPVLILTGLAFAVCADSYVKKSFRRIMLAIVTIVLTLIGSTCMSNEAMRAWKPSYVTFITGLSIYRYIMRPACIVLFIYIVWDSPKRCLFWIPAGMNALVYMTAFFRPWVFRIDQETGLFYRGPLGYTAHGISCFLIVSQVIVTLVHFRRVRWVDKLLPITNSLLAVIAVWMDSMC